MIATAQVHIVGIAPLIMHNGRLRNPLDPSSKQIKEITSKRKKADTDLLELSRLEWFGGLYTNADGALVVPGMNIEATLVAGAKKSKLGKQFQAAVFCDEDPKLLYDGPKDLDALWEHEGFRLIVGAKVQQSAVMRCRPIFRNWELKFKLSYMDDIVNPSDVRRALDDGGRLVGLCDWRPKFGRFEVRSCK